MGEQKVVTLGEAMIRLSPPDSHRLEQASSFDAIVGGGELNVAVGVARLGLESAWVSKLPRNALGLMVRNKAREQGVDTSNIVWSDSGRVGLYFLEFGASPRASSVLYDRANSAISTLALGEVDWKKTLDGCQVFHVSGITPALSKSCAEATLEAVKAAKTSGAKVSFDVNYRKKLWTPEEASACLVPMMEFVDFLITTEEDTGVVFGIREKSYQEVAVKLNERLRGRRHHAEGGPLGPEKQLVGLCLCERPAPREPGVRVRIGGPGRGRGLVHRRVHLWLPDGRCSEGR